MLFKTRERKDRQGIVSFLHQLVDILAEGEVMFRQGTNDIKVVVPDRVILNSGLKKRTRKAERNAVF